MNEVDLWMLLGQYNSYGITAIALYVTVALSYLVAAYLAGAKLTRSDRPNGDICDWRLFKIHVERQAYQRR